MPLMENLILKIGATTPGFGGILEGTSMTYGYTTRALSRHEIARLADGKTVREGPAAN